MFAESYLDTETDTDTDTDTDTLDLVMKMQVGDHMQVIPLRSFADFFQNKRKQFPVGRENPNLLK